MGFSLACGPDISALECLLARVVHAHLVIEYVIEGGNVPVPEPEPEPEDVIFLVDLDEAFVIDTDGANIVVEAP
jgi:hypothetical protein